MAPVLDQIIAEVARAAELCHRLVLLVGETRTGKTRTLRALAAQRGWPLLNVNLLLSERLLDYSEKRRPVCVAEQFDEMLASVEGDIVLLDNIEILFDPALAQDPLRLLQGRSRDRALVVAWPGSYGDEKLTYAEPQHPEWKAFRKPDARVVIAQPDFRLAHRNEGTHQPS